MNRESKGRKHEFDWQVTPGHCSEEKTTLTSAVQGRWRQKKQGSERPPLEIVFSTE